MCLFFSPHLPDSTTTVIILPDSCFLLLFPEIWIIKTASAGTLLVPYPDPLESSFPILCVPPPASACFACHSLHLWAILRGLPLPLAYWSWVNHRWKELALPRGLHLGRNPCQCLTGRGRKAQLPCSEAGQMLKHNLLSRAPMGIRLWLGCHLSPVCSLLTLPVLLPLFPYRSSPAALPPTIISKSSSSIQLLDGQP